MCAQNNPIASVSGGMEKPIYVIVMKNGKVDKSACIYGDASCNPLTMDSGLQEFLVMLSKQSCTTAKSVHGTGTSPVAQIATPPQAQNCDDMGCWDEKNGLSGLPELRFNIFDENALRQPQTPPQAISPPAISPQAMPLPATQLIPLPATPPQAISPPATKHAKEAAKTDEVSGNEIKYTDAQKEAVEMLREKNGFIAFNADPKNKNILVSRIKIEESGIKKTIQIYPDGTSVEITQKEGLLYGHNYTAIVTKPWQEAVLIESGDLDDLNGEIFTLINMGSNFSF